MSVPFPSANTTNAGRSAGLVSGVTQCYPPPPCSTADKSVPSASITNDGLQVVDDVPNSAVELQVKEKVGGKPGWTVYTRTSSDEGR